MLCRLILPVALMLTACMGAEGTVRNWEGHHLNELLHAWGPPNDIRRLDDGRRIVTYVHAREGGARSVQDLGGGVKVLHGSGSYQCQAVFRADSGGRITDYTVAGTVDGCDRLFGEKPGPAG